MNAVGQIEQLLPKLGEYYSDAADNMDGWSLEQKITFYRVLQDQANWLIQDSIPNRYK